MARSVFLFLLQAAIRDTFTNYTIRTSLLDDIKIPQRFHHADAERKCEESSPDSLATLNLKPHRIQIKNNHFGKKKKRI